MKEGGFILVEATLASAIIGFALVALVPTFVLSIKAGKIAEQTKAAAQLSTALLEEIRLRRWDELTPLTPRAISAGSAALGADSGESATDKRTFDDADDFNGWSESLPQDPMAQPLDGFSGYSRSVTVNYVDSAMASSSSPTDYKQVHVCTRAPKGTSQCLDTLLTNR